MAALDERLSQSLKVFKRFQIYFLSGFKTYDDYKHLINNID